MATNTVTIKNSKAVYVNNILVYTCPTAADATSMKNALNDILGDTNRDLDFVTPTYIEGTNQYAVCCPLVRANQNEVTYFFNDSYPKVSRKLYNTSNASVFTGKSKRTLIYKIPSSVSAPWHEALILANNIRYAAKLHYNCLKENSPHLLQKLVDPTNTSNVVDKVISTSCSCQFYGHPDQGTQQGANSWSSSMGCWVQNISSPICGNADVLHPQDITAAMTSTNKWNTTYKNKYVKVTTSDGKKSIVVRVTDTAPANKGIELTWRAYHALGKPSCVRVELMK